MTRKKKNPEEENEEVSRTEAPSLEKQLAEIEEQFKRKLTPGERATLTERILEAAAKPPPPPPPPPPLVPRVTPPTPPPPPPFAPKTTTYEGIKITETRPGQFEWTIDGERHATNTLQIAKSLVKRQIAEKEVVVKPPEVGVPIAVPPPIAPPVPIVEPVVEVPVVAPPEPVFTPPEKVDYYTYTGKSKLATAGIHKGKTVYEYITETGAGKMMPEEELHKYSAYLASPEDWTPPKLFEQAEYTGKTVMGSVRGVPTVKYIYTGKGGGYFTEEELISPAYVVPGWLDTPPSPAIQEQRALITERDKYRTGTPEWEERNIKVTDYKYEPTVTPPPKPPPEVVPPTTADDLVLQSRLTGFELSLKDQLQLLADGKITQTEFNSREESLEQGHTDWFKGFQETGATKAETEAIIEARGAESAAQLEATVEQILTMEAEGEITHRQSVAAVEAYKEKQHEEAKDIISGEDVRAAGSSLGVRYTFEEEVDDRERVAVEEKLQPVTVVPVTKTVTTEVWTAKIVDPKTGEIIKEEKFDDEKDAKTWAAYQEMLITRLPTIERERAREIVEEVAPELITTTVTVDPNLVTYMGITMSREQFEADFPEGTTPDPVVKTAVVPVDIAKGYEDVMSIIPDSLRDSAEILSERSQESAMAGKPWEGFVNYLGSVAYRGSAAVYDTGTFLIRPELWRQQAEAIGYLLAADKPETRAQHNQRIADFVEGDIDDPTTQAEVTKFLQETVPFTPQDQEYLDKAKEYRKAFGEQIAADPFRFAVEIAASVYTAKVVGNFLGDLKGNIKNYGKASGFDDAFVQQQIDKMRPLSEIADLIDDVHVAEKFRDLPEPEMFRGTDLQPPPDVEAWSADIITTADPTKVFRAWEPGANKGAWQNQAALEIARDVAAKGGQTLVYLRDPLTNQVAGVMTQADYFRMIKTEPLAFAGLGVTITVVDVGGAESILNQAVKDGIFDKGFTPTPVTQNKILTTIDKTLLQTVVTDMTTTQLKDIDLDTMVDVLPKLELDTISQIIPAIGKDIILDTITKLDAETIVKVIPSLDKDTAVTVIPDLDRDTMVAVIPELDKDTIVDVTPKLDVDVIQDILPKLDKDVQIDVVTDLDEDTKIVVIPTLDKDVIIDIVPKLGKDTIVDVVPKLDIDVIQEVLPVLDTDVVIDVVQELDDDTIVALVPTLDPVIIPDIITVLDTDIVVDVIVELDEDTIAAIMPALDDTQIQELVPRLEMKLSPGRFDYIGRRLPPRVRRKFRMARRKWKPIRPIPSKEPEPYRIAFQYATGASETERVEAHTYHEALVVAQEQKTITLDPVEVEVEKLAPGALLTGPSPVETAHVGVVPEGEPTGGLIGGLGLMGAPMGASSPEKPKIKPKVKKLKKKVKRKRRPAPLPDEKRPEPKRIPSGGKRRHKKEGKDPRRKRERKRRVRLVK